MIRETLISAGLLVLRAAFGGFMMVHGIQKLSGFSDMASSFPDPLGIGNQLSLVAAIGTEVGCSVLLIFGLATRFAALGLAFTMLVALFIVHADDPWKTKELAACYLAVYAAIMLAGPGKFSLDHAVVNRRKRKDRAEG